MYAVDQAPHDWLFPRCAAVVHHGGSGTTGAAFRAGVPQQVVAHEGDQEYFGRRAAALGCGPAPLKRHEVAGRRLAEAITAMTGDPAMAARAAALGRRVDAEDGVGRAVRQIERWVSTR